MNAHLGTRAALAAYALGGLAVAWVAAGYVPSNPLALVMTLLIGAVYAVGGLELRRFHQASQALDGALQGLATDPAPADAAGLDAWLARLPAGLAPSVRLRIAGQRVALPGPGLTPYLVGLLVLLGMLGTFVGMVVTLKGAVSALEATSDLAAIRAALTAPVRGLGVAFGTSVAGVAASAMLGLVSALCRRERLAVAQALDAAVAGALRVFHPAHQRDQQRELQREQALRLQQQQVQALPDVAAQLQALITQFGQQSQGLMAQLAQQNQALSTQLAQHSEAVAAQLARHGQAVAAEVGGLGRTVAAEVAQHSREAMAELARQGQAVSETVAGHTREAMAQVAQHSAGTATGLTQQLDTLAGQLAQQHQALATQLADGQTQFHREAGSAYTALAASVDQSLRDSLAESARQAGATLAPVVQATMDAIGRDTTTLHERTAGALEQRLDGLSQRFDSAMAQVTSGWAEALAEHRRHSGDAADALRQALDGAARTLANQSGEVLARLDAAHAGWTEALAAQDAQRQATLTQAVQGMASALQAEWQQAGAQAQAQQAQICATLEATAQRLQAQAEAQSRDTLAEMAAVMAGVAEAPRAAAEVIGQLREKLSDSMARDNALLEERTRILDTLGGLLATVNAAATEQRSAIDGLVASSGAMLAQTAAQFGERVQAESTRLADTAAQIAGSATDVASLGEAFGGAVAQFGASSQVLTAHLERLEAALSQATARSDEQLAYYVAQAREVIDLSLLSQKQIVEDLQRLAQQPSLFAAEAG
ncbi:DUF802 domain-containing protein [Ideonella sp. DXS22W]|uniref:DUF802 domain-containing protein n=1 Tax=Pseudaquabacterium inlustre TaxID=2984192 RepID=A0ABU9CK73_9BURK